MADPTESNGAAGSGTSPPVLTEVPNAGRLKSLLMLATGVVVLASGAGYGVAFLMPSSALSGPAQAEGAQQAAAPAAEPAASAAHGADKAEKADFVYYDFEPIIVNLDEPRLARYVRVTLTLAIKPQNHEAAKAVLEKHKPELKNWLTLYFASCTLDSVRGAVSLNRLRREIYDAFCQQLWPDQKPLIDHILFKEFGVS
jgi:flagellar basal body-associated protein FliL